MDTTAATPEVGGSGTPNDPSSSSSPSVSRSQSLRSSHNNTSASTSSRSVSGAGGSPLASGSTLASGGGVSPSMSLSASVSSAGGGSSAVAGTPRRKRATTRSKGSAAAGGGTAGAASGGSSTPARSAQKPRDRHTAALASIRAFLQGRSSYDVLPVSFRVIVLDTRLVIKPALDVMWQAGIVSAPLWHSSPIKAAPGKSSEGAEAGAGVSTSESPPANESGTSENASAGEADSPAPAPLPASSPPPAAPAPAARKHGFAGMLTVNDIIHLIQYYYQHSSYDSAAQDVEHFRLEMLSDIERYLKVPQPPLLSIHPLRPLYEACQMLIKTHARRLPLLDYDEQTGMETVVSVITQYRVLKFIAMNCRETMSLTKSIRQLGIGTYTLAARAGRSTMATSQSNSSGQQSRSASVFAGNATNAGEEGSAETPAAQSADETSTRTHSNSPEPLDGAQSSQAQAAASNPYAPLATATLDTTVFDVVHLFSELGISAVPILDADGHVVDLYETVDVITLVRTSAYQSLDLTIRQALRRRPADFPGVYTCGPDDSLASIFALLRKRRVHRLLVLEPVLPEEADSEHAQPAGPAEPRGGSSTAMDGDGLPLPSPQHINDDMPTPLAGDGNPLSEAFQAASARAPRPPTTQIPLSVLDAELESGVTRRRGRGRLVGILCLSDILRYVIGASSVGAAGGRARAGTAAAPSPSPARTNDSAASAGGLQAAAGAEKEQVQTAEDAHDETLQAEPVLEGKAATAEAQGAAVDEELKASLGGDQGGPEGMAEGEKGAEGEGAPAS